MEEEKEERIMQEEISMQVETSPNEKHTQTRSSARKKLERLSGVNRNLSVASPGKGFSPGRKLKTFLTKKVYGIG